MSHFADLTSWALSVLRGASFGFFALPLIVWSVLSFGVAILLGRAIRRADERAGVLDDELMLSLPGEPDQASPDQACMAAMEADGRSRREPTRSGPFLIDHGVQASFRAQLKRKAQ